MAAEVKAQLPVPASGKGEVESGDSYECRRPDNLVYVSINNNKNVPNEVEGSKMLKVDFQPSLTCADKNVPALHTYSYRCIYSYTYITSTLIHKNV